MADDKKVMAPVLWDNDDTFQGGKHFAVSAAAIVVGTTPRPDAVYLPSAYQQTINYVNTLQIKDPVFNDLYLNMTLDDWRLLVGTTNVSPGGFPDPIVWVGDDTIPAGCVLTSTDLIGIDILSVNKGGITIYNYIHHLTDPTLDLTADGCLAAGETIQIIYKRP